MTFNSHILLRNIQTNRLLNQFHEVIAQTTVLYSTFLASLSCTFGYFTELLSQRRLAMLISITVFFGKVM